MTFEQYVNSIEKDNPLYYVGLKYLREVWDAARTDPIKQQMYEALKYVVDAKGVLIEGEIADEILPAIKAYEENN